MSFPYTHPKTGGICCSTQEACCDSCKAKLAAEARGAGRSRAAAGARHGKADQQHLNDAHDALVTAGATCGDPRAAAAPDPFRIARQSPSADVAAALQNQALHLNIAH